MRHFRSDTYLAWWVAQGPKRVIFCSSPRRRDYLRQLFPALRDHFIIPGEARGAELKACFVEETREFSAHEWELLRVYAQRNKATAV